ncbi:hypothetical protein LTR40_002042 [Exophiala xenobiotica]|nr:hypothetical protein LTR40_002042 [Exophiala xenobiotica]
MALNAASHNVTGDPTGSPSGPPPPVSSEIASAAQNAAKEDAMGNNVPGQDQQGNDSGQTVMGAAGKPKTAKEIEKERKKAEKLAKFQEKQSKKQVPAADTASKAPKKEKVKKAAAVDAYEPQKIESGRYEWWESRGLFKPQFTKDGKIKPEGKFVIPIPPPNVTGSLHMGHALTNSLQDTMIRHARMKGKTTAWIPGCDHAGIATQSVVERMVYKTEGKTRHDIGRDALLEKIWSWKEKYHSNITNQLKRLGGSMDWSREAFTMDENLSLAVRKTFIDLFDEGIIYRANRLVNWCSALSTSLSNLEVDNKELKGRTKLKVPGYDKMIEFGVLTYFKYPISKGDDSHKTSTSSTRFQGYEFIEIATTRPETMLGDTGIAVHPNDKRYQHLVGKTAIHPFIPDRKIIIFADEEVEMDFGTGAVKITPAHDTNDFNKGKKHNLEFINILNDDGTLNDNAGPFAGQKRFDVRYGVINALKELDLYTKQEDNAMTIPMCQRSKDVIEPVMKPQWWMRMADLAKAADEAVLDGRIAIKPETESRRFHFWMQNIQDWCISRQLWWGHRAPAYFIELEGDIAFDIREIEAKRRFCNKIYQATNFALGRLGEEFVPDAKLTDNEPESLSEKWILHRLNTATKEVNEAIEGRDFSVAAHTLYQYWFTQLCDTFIENSKYILTPEAPEKERKSAQQTLYTALEGGLLLMHPLMPFLTEHLWQKLPRRNGDTTESIMIAKYPEYVEKLDNPLEAEKYEFIMAIATGIRSLLSQYGFKEPGDLIIQTYSEAAFNTVSEERTSLKSLGGKYAGEIEVLPPSATSLPPAGCALQSINADAAVYLKVAGKIDLAEELKKREKGVEDAKARVEKSKKIMSAAGWEKANPETRTKEQEKLEDAESEVTRLEEAIRDLERLKMEG